MTSRVAAGRTPGYCSRRGRVGRGAIDARRMRSDSVVRADGSTVIFETISPQLPGPLPPLKITDVECYALLAPDFDPGFTSSAQDSFLVVIRTDGGVFGVGECDANPWMAKACIEAPGTHTMGLSIRDLLIGADPFRIGELWRTCYVGSAMNGRRGMVIHALGAVEMALWDLCGKAVGLPVHALLGGATRDAITLYASLLPGGDTFAAYRAPSARRPGAPSISASAP